MCCLHPKAQHHLLLHDQLLHSRARLGPVQGQQQVRLGNKAVGDGGKDEVKLTLKCFCSFIPGPPVPVRQALAPQPSTSNSQRHFQPRGTAAKSSSRLTVPSAIPRPSSRMPLTSRSVPPGKGALPPDSASTRKGLPRPSTTGHRGEGEWT